MTDLPTLPIMCMSIRNCGSDGVYCSGCHNKRIVLAHAAAHQKEILYYDCEQTTKATAARDAVLALAELSCEDLEGKRK